MKKPSVSYSFLGEGNIDAVLVAAQAAGFEVKAHGKRGPSKTKSDVTAETAQTA